MRDGTVFEEPGQGRAGQTPFQVGPSHQISAISLLLYRHSLTAFNEML